MRVLGSILGVPALLLGFLQAPFDHIHPEEVEHQSLGPVHLHVHESATTGQGPFVGAHEPDEHEVDVPWNAAVSASVIIHPDAELAQPLLLADDAAASVAVSVPRHRGHDPPESSPKIPRAPPA